MKSGEQKGMMQGLLVAVVFIGAIYVGYTYLMEEPEPLTWEYPPGATPAPPGVPGVPGAPPAGPCVGLAATPTVTLETYDRYNQGTAITTKNMYRKVGGNTWTNVAGTGTIQLSAGTEIELVFGIDSTDEVEEPPGEHMYYTLPCAETATLSVPVANDVDDTSHATITVFDENGATGAQAVGAGDVKTVFIDITGKYEYDLGNIDCGETSNLLIAKYNTTSIDDIEVTGVTMETPTKKSYTVSTAGVPVGIAGALTATNFGLQGWELPVLESNSKYRVTYVIDADDTENPGASDLEWYIADSAHYLDNDDNTIKCGVEDEDQTDIGLTGRISQTTVIS